MEQNPRPEANTDTNLNSDQLTALPSEPVLLDLIRLLWRHKMLILVTLTLLMSVSVLIVFQLEPRYTAEARILVGTRTANVVDIKNVLETLRPDRTTIQGEVELIASRNLAEQVVDELELVNIPEFNRVLRPPPWFHKPLVWLREPPDWLLNSPTWIREPLQWLRGQLVWLYSVLLGDTQVTALTPEEAASKVRDDTVSALMESMNVEPVRVSYVVSVSVTAEDAELAALIANTLSDIYLRNQLNQKFRETEKAAAWLNERVRSLRDQVEISERAVEDYRQSQGLTQTSDSTLVEQQISEINSQLIVARAATSEAEAKVRRVRELAKQEDGAYSDPEVLSSPLIQGLRLQETNLVGEAAQMSQEYGSQHPRMININAELEDIRTTIRQEVRRIVLSLENSLEVARTREHTLQASLEDLKKESTQLTASQARLRVLEREAEANQELFDVFLSRHMETGDQEGLFSADAQVISRATIPIEPSWPDMQLAMGASFVISGLLALLVVFLVEQLLERGFRHSEQLQAGLKVDSLGAIPWISEDEKSIIRHVLDNPMSAFSESLRMLHTGLLATYEEEPNASSLLITSSIPNEGKTTLAICLARLTARSGIRTLLIDSDLRHGQVAKRVGLTEECGLTHLLSDHSMDIDKAIQHDQESGLDVIAAGHSLKIKTDIIRKQQMLKILSQLKTRYELVIIDSPPTLLVSDTLTLAQCVDDTVYVIRYAKTTRNIAVTGISKILSAQGRIAGAILSMAAGHRRGYYSYGYNSYAYGTEPYGLSKKYRHYYTSK